MKLFHIISTSILGAAMAVGVGLAAANAKKDLKRTEAALSGTNATFELVSSNLEDWSGEFLIVSGTTLWDASSSISDSGTYVTGLTISNNKITTDTSYAWTIDSMGSNNYSITGNIARQCRFFP